ncbi:pre-peptidase C-terminal domain-containing protein [Pseudonocardia broussonetiae]|uniref:Uncharacterized protein n=1 Tax=Pseudonocardia broussonetiae TaxID=2736640 RepID=A0A6M6JF64_9PSEU|nr:pre-peptidase C-terminal domain-containing protein [Pseudonocardia broussonetiae]QJY45121.1 hypothetical protein HOP40_04185 [Pseudonocardia broussonetiae]
MPPPKGDKPPGLDPCPGEALEQLSKSRTCTHGPDPAPPGVDIAKDAPVSPGAPPAIQCVGDGVSGFRTHALYVRASDVADGFAGALPQIRSVAGQADQIYSSSAAATGGSRGIRFVHDSTCTVIVDNVVVSPTGDDNIDNTIAELQSRGYNRSDRKYMIFVDANVICGQGTIQTDDQAGQNNRNNQGPSYGRNDRGCWTGQVVAHELMHNLGGVQNTAPNASGGFHCTDEWDVLCYSDSPNFPAMRTVCPDPALDTTRLDCGNDDYCHTAPQPGSYLATRWNTANSTFLIGGGPGPGQCPDQAFEPDDAVGQARAVAVPSSEQHAYCGAGDHDWIRIDTLEGVTYRFTTANLATGNDTVLDLIAADGSTILVTNDDSGGTLASSIEHVATRTGTLYIRSRHFNAGAAGVSLTYALNVEALCTDQSEPNGSASQATVATVGAVARHTYCVPGDQDWVRFEATAGRSYTIKTQNLAAGTDTVLHLLAANGTTELAVNDDSGGTLASLITYSATTTGPLYVRSHHFNANAGYGTLRYDLLIEAGGVTTRELLANPGFELDANTDTRPDSWSINTRFTRSTSYRHSGTYSGRHSSTTNAAYTVEQVVPVVSGAGYVFAGRVNIPATTDAFTMRAQIQWVDNANVAIGSPITIRTYSAQTAGWDSFRGASRTAPPGAVRAKVLMSLSSLNARVYVDSFSFVGP